MQMSFEEAMESVKVIHKFSISDRNTAIIGQGFENGRRSKNLFIILHNDKNGRWFSMRLRTWRTLLKNMAKRNLMDLPRKLTIKEKVFGEVSAAEKDYRTIQAKIKRAEKKKKQERHLKAKALCDEFHKKGIHLEVDDDLNVKGYVAPRILDKEV